MAGAKCNSIPVKFRSRPYYSRRCKQNKSFLTSIDSLPYELLFNILLRLPAEYIYNNAMPVCRKWYDMIRTQDFILAHLHHHSSSSSSSQGILIRNFVDDDYLSLVSIGQGGRVGVSKLSYRIRYLDWYSCNGLILLSDYKQPPLFNPATNQSIQIPQVPQYSILDRISLWISIACSASSNQYKLVQTVYSNNGNNNQADMLLCNIVTVGVDKSWRRLCTDYLSPSSKDLMCHSSAVTVGGFIHCVCDYGKDRHCHDNYLLTLNVETETFTENPIPQGLEERSKYFCSSGKSLSLFTIDGGLCYEVWDMKSETGEWTKMEIDLRPHKSEFEEVFGCVDCGSNVTPCGWLKYQEVVVFRFRHPAKFHLAYNVRTHEIDWFELATTYFDHKSNAHTSSLVGLV